MVKRRDRRALAKRTTATLRAHRLSGGGRVLVLHPSAATRHIDAPTAACVKCGSTFIGHEPAFIHCFYCGNMARIAGGSLLAQELFEIRCGLRLAS
jgi:hypothetical protein